MRVVICGAGTAGCVAAARLSQDPDNDVLLLEAGPHHRPGRWPSELRHAYRVVTETHNWNYQARGGLPARSVSVPRGRVVGGSSATNGAIALRGHPDHYDEWDADVDGYDWPTWLPWFRAIERDLDFGNEPAHGSSGPITISRHPQSRWLELQERFAEAAIAAGHSWIADHNAPGALGVGPIPLNMIDGQRQTPADHYLDPALARPNLTLRTGVTVDRVCLRAGRACGVRIVGPDGRVDTLEADAVVLTLGSYATPSVLLRSGVGPTPELRRHGIQPMVDLPGVGTGLQDHPKVSYRFDLDIAAPGWPNPWYQCLLTGSHTVAGEPRTYQVMTYSGFVDGGRCVTELSLQLSDARSRYGSVRLNSPDPGDPPAITMGWFREPSDHTAALEAAQRLRDIAATAPLAQVLAPWPGHAEHDYIRRTVQTFHHPAGTCRMGRPTAKQSVVDAQGRVHGLSGLSIMDASVIPRIPSANIHLAVIALAERLAATFSQSQRQ